jgi:hypothetical protein
MLVAGNGSVVHSLSCSDVWSAMVNAGASYNVAKAAAKISAEDDTDTTYKLVYGLFASPMEYAREERPDTYYFEALDWYIREARSGHAPPATGPYYVKGVRGIAIYSTLKGQSTTTGSANASAGFSAPVFSIDASASDNAESNGQIKTRIFHVLLGQASSANLPSFADTVKYLSAINANPKSQVSFDKQRQNLKMSVEIDGMPHSLCRRDIWQASPRTKGSTDSPHPSLALVDAVYHKPGESVVQGSVRTASQCEFELSAEVDPGDTADFTGILSPNMGGIVTSNEPSKDPSLAIWFDVPYSLPNPKLSALDTPSADSKNEGDWEFQIEQGNGIDKSVDPDTSAVTLICSPALTQLAVTNATFESVFKNAKGSYLKVHASLSPATADVKTCTLGGFVKLTGVNGVAANACIGKSPCPSKSSNVKVGTNAAGSN